MANGWEETDSLQETVGYAAASYDDKMVVTGGRRSYARDAFLSTTHIYEDRRWTKGPYMPQKLVGHCQVTVNRTVLVTGKVVTMMLNT